MKYCKHCGAQMKDSAVFCPSCGKKTQETDSIQVWENLNEQTGSKHGRPVTDHETVQNLMKKLPDGTVDQMKELTGKAKDGVSHLAEKAREYGGRFAEKAGDFTQDASQAQAVRNIPVQKEKRETVRKPHKGTGKILAVVLLLLVLVIGGGGIYYLSRFTLVGVWKVVDTDDVDLSNIDLTDPKDILEKTLLTLGSGTRIVFTKEGDLFATASLGGVTLGPGTMSYSKNGNDSFTIQASVDVILTTLSANYSCSYEFDGPDRLLVHLGEATLTLTRDTAGDPEEYLNQIPESGIGISLPFGGNDDEDGGINLPFGGDDDEDDGISIPESGEELKEDLQNIGNSLSDALDSFYSN